MGQATRMVPPGRSVEQRMAALRRGNEIRTFRGAYKRGLKLGDESPLRAFEEAADPRFASMKVLDLLLAMPKVGRSKANKALAAARVSPSKTLGGITARQRAELIRFLPALARARAARTQR